MRFVKGIPRLERKDVDFAIVPTIRARIKYHGKEVTARKELDNELLLSFESDNDLKEQTMDSLRYALEKMLVTINKEEMTLLEKTKFKSFEDCVKDAKNRGIKKPEEYCSLMLSYIKKKLNKR